MIKLIVTDVDGTLVKDGSRDINPEYFTVFKKLIDKGVSICAASGRSKDGIYDLFGPVRDEIYISCNNGTQISRNDKIYLKECISPETVKAIAEKLRSIKGLNTVIAKNDMVYYFPDASNKFYELITKGYGFNAFKFESYDKISDVSKVCCFCFDKGENPGFKFRNDFPGVKAFPAGEGWVDFIPENISKGETVKFLQNLLNITPDETAVFGDHDNDIEMYKYANYSFSADSGSKLSKESASEVIPGFKSDGVLHKIIEMFEL